MLLDFTAIKKVPVAAEAAALEEMSQKTNFAMQSAQEELELAMQQVHGDAQQQLQQVQQQIERAQQASERGDFRQAQQEVEQASQPIKQMVQTGELQQQPQQQIAAESPLAAMPASDLVGSEVQNAEGETVAEIVDLVKEEGEEDVYAVLSVGGFLGIGDKRIVVRLDELDVGQRGEIIMANASEDQLRDMPEYMKEDFESAAGLREHPARQQQPYQQ